jgi:hypothetical protein
MIRNRVLAQLSLSGASFLGALFLLLLLGTQILDWWVPLTLGVIAFGAGLVWVFVKAPARKSVARILDRRCNLADALSTAEHFRDSTNEVALAQRRQAETLAHSVDLAVALPFRLPRSAYVLAGLAVAAAGVFLLRYGTEPHLDLRAPMALIRIDPLALAARADAKSREHKNAKPDGAPTDLMSRLGDSTPDNPLAQQLGNAPEEAVSTGADAKDGGKAQLDDGKKESGDAEESSADQGAGAPKGASDQPPGSRDGAPQSAQAGGKTPGASEGASSGLMSRLRDAVSGLLSKMKPGQPPQGAQQANGKQSNTSQQNGQKSGQQGQPGQQGNQSQQEGSETAAADSEQMMPGQGAGKGSDQNASAKPGSGMGRQDGAKEIKDAEQLAAMGKLSEIIGRRSANVTGEMTIDPQSGPQQLRTNYTRSAAKHGESGGDVSRDEVPVALQSYVQQYFEQVRKKPVKTARVGKAEAHP